MSIKGGYDVAFEKTLAKKYVCPLCKKALREPVQTQCGHRFCSTCINPVLRGPSPHCPLDEEPLSEREVFNDVCCKREVLGLICFCMNNKHGCEWKKELMYLEDHLRHCEYREVPCPNQGCKDMIPMKKLDQHVKESCNYKPSSCQHRGERVPEAQMEAHLLKCEKVPITCQYCGMSGILRELQNDHIENHCEAAEKPCKFKDVGCLFKGKLEDLNEHYDCQKDEHLKLTVQSMDSSKKLLEELSQKVGKAKEKTEKLEKELSEHRESFAANPQNLRSYQARLSKAEKGVAENKSAIAQIRERTEDAASSKGGKTCEVSLQLEEFRSALADQEEKLRSFERELARGVGGGGLRSFSSSSLTLDRRLDRNEHQLALHDIQLAEHDLKIQMREATSNDGTYNWKIDEFSRRKKHDEMCHYSFEESLDSKRDVEEQSDQNREYFKNLQERKGREIMNLEYEKEYLEAKMKKSKEANTKQDLQTKIGIIEEYVMKQKEELDKLISRNCMHNMR